MTSDLLRELRELLSALCDGALTDAQSERLEQLLADHPECRTHYLEYLDLHTRLLLHPTLGQSEGLPAAPRHEAASIDDDSPLPATDPMKRSTVQSTPSRVAGRQSVRYALVAAATLLLSLGLQIAWWPSRGTDSGARPPHEGKAETQSSGYVATLVQTADCTWDVARQHMRAGSRLPTGKLRLQKGIARIRLDTGAELMVEGPCDLRLDSNTAATLELGKLVLRADETASPFELRTPSATIVEYGAEYAVTVSPYAEEIHVIEGAVQRTAREGGVAKAVPLREGEARRFDRSATAEGRPATFDAARFVRHLPPAIEPPAESRAVALTYEGFVYERPEHLHAGKADGGYGWKGPWQVGIAQPLEWGEKKRLPLNVDDGLLRPGSESSSIGGRFDHAGFGNYIRRLAEPVRLDTDGVYYLSFLFRRFGPPAHPHNVVSVQLRPREKHGQWPDASKRLTIGVGGFNQLFTHLGKMNARASLPMTGSTYLLIAKIVTGSTTSEQVFVRVYGPNEPVSVEEPDSWTLLSPPFQSSQVLDSFAIQVNSKNRQMVDEIRLGLTWESVASPWLGEPSQKAPQP